MAPAFPSIYGANYSTQNGRFFQRRGDIWIQIERYLPCATGTLNEPLEATAQRWLNELEKGTLKTKRTIGSTGDISGVRETYREYGRHIGSTGDIKKTVYELTENGLKSRLPIRFAK